MDGLGLIEWMGLHWDGLDYIGMDGWTGRIG